MDRYIDRELIKFVQHLHDMNSDWYGLMSKEGHVRAQRWMDAVLPPDVYFPSEALPPELRKAAE